MKLQEVIDNINRTIEGKMALRDALAQHGPAFARMVEINLDELKAIRADLLKVQASS